MSHISLRATFPFDPAAWATRSAVPQNFWKQTSKQRLNAKWFANLSSQCLVQKNEGSGYLKISCPWKMSCQKNTFGLLICHQIKFWREMQTWHVQPCNISNNFLEVRNPEIIIWDWVSPFVSVLTDFSHGIGETFVNHLHPQKISIGLEAPHWNCLHIELLISLLVNIDIY